MAGRRTDPVEGVGSAAQGGAAPVLRTNWARLLKRVFAIDIEKCDDCGDRVKMRPGVTKPGERTYLIARIALNHTVLLETAASAAGCVKSGSGGVIPVQAIPLVVRKSRDKWDITH